MWGAAHFRAASFGVLERNQFHTPDLDLVSRGQPRVLDSPAVHERTVRALEVFHLQFARRERRDAAVNARHERRIQDEVGAGRAAERPRMPGQKPERPLAGWIAHRSKNPHAQTEPFA